MNALAILLLISAVTATAVLTVPALRRPLLTRHLLAGFRQVLPRMSDTEREALQAGGVWWDAEIFSGRPQWQRLLDLPRATLSDEEQAFLAGPVETLCRMLDDWRITHETLDLDAEVWSFIRRERLFGLVIPQSYGGLGFSHLAHSEVVMKLASRSIAGAVTVMVPNSLGPAELLLRYGTDAQRRHHLPRLASGDSIPCFALTGPHAGSDAASMPDEGIVCRGSHSGRESLMIRLRFEKRYITLGPVATLIGLAFRLRDPDGLLGDDPEPGITLALIPSTTAGVEQGRRHLPMSAPFQNGPISGRNVMIPLDWVIGGRAGIGQGWSMLMEALSEGRGTSLPALSTGGAKLAARYTGAYARIRRQFGRPIGTFEGVQEPLARIAGITYQMDAARRVFLDALTAGERPAVLSAILKYHLTEGYRQVINDAMDIQGGSGICLGPGNPLGRVYQGIPIAITVEGANILTRSMIIFGQGALRCHPHVLTELEAAHNPNPGHAIRAFDSAITAHLGFLTRNLSRTLWLGLTPARWVKVPANGEIGRYLQQLERLSAAFALNADLAMMTLGGSLKYRERLSARLGDILSLLVLASCTLKHFDNQGRSEADLPLLRWAMADHLHGIQQAFIGLWANLPNHVLAQLVKRLTFPTSNPFPAPDDRLDRDAAGVLLAPSSARDRLTAGIFTTRDETFPTGKMELALEASLRADAIRDILRQATKSGRIPGPGAIREAVDAGVLRPSEAALLRRAEQLVDQAIAVDSFDDLGKRGRRKNPDLGRHAA